MLSKQAREDLLVRLMFCTQTHTYWMHTYTYNTCTHIQHMYTHTSSSVLYSVSVESSRRVEDERERVG